MMHSELELLSIHIPKTAGTSFYNVLFQVYDEQLSISYKRRHLKPLFARNEIQRQQLPPGLKAMHGHFYYREVRTLHYQTNARVICWLRNPVDRVISNYNFFMAGLQNPSRNPANYERNKHRLHEDLLTYASREENRNRIHRFLDGINLDELFFIGRQESFLTDLQRLGKLLAWPEVEVPKLNQKTSSVKTNYSEAVMQKLRALNSLDMELYQQALALIKKDL